VAVAVETELLEVLAEEVVVLAVAVAAAEEVFLGAAAVVEL
jgi:hypothetical protein